MKDCEIPDLNLFMACPALRREALAPMPQGFYLRSLRGDEWALWKTMPFDEPPLAQAYDEYMTAYFDRTYKAQEALFYERCQVICDASDQPVGTALPGCSTAGIGPCTGLRCLRDMREGGWDAVC